MRIIKAYKVENVGARPLHINGLLVMSCEDYIMSGEQGLYEKYGFVKMGDFKTRYGTEDQLFQKTL